MTTQGVRQFFSVFTKDLFTWRKRSGIEIVPIVSKCKCFSETSNFKIFVKCLINTIFEFLNVMFLASLKAKKIENSRLFFLNKCATTLLKLM